MSRWTGAVFLLPLCAVTLFVLPTVEGDAWGQWAWAVDLMTGITVLTGPVLAACAAHLGWTQAQLDDLVGTTPRAGWVPLRCAFQAWSWGIVGYAISVVAIVVLTWLAPHGGPFPLWAAAIGIPVLGVCALVGALAVRVFPYRLTVLAVAPAVFLAGTFGPDPYADLLRQGPSTGSLSGLRLDTEVWLFQFGGLLALAGALVGALGVAARSVRASRLVALPGALVLVSLVVLLVCGAALDDPGRQRLTVSDERPTLCHGSAPVVCVAPSSTYGLASTERLLRRALQHLGSVGVKLPDRYEERLPSYRPPPYVGVVGVEVDDLRSAARSAATPAACLQWTDEQVVPEKALMARELIGLWIRAREGETVGSWTLKGDAWLKRAADPDVAAWIRTTYAQLRSCDFVKIRMPWTQAKRG